MPETLTCILTPSRPSETSPPLLSKVLRSQREKAMQYMPPFYLYSPMSSFSFSLPRSFKNLPRHGVYHGASSLALLAFRRTNLVIE